MRRMAEPVRVVIADDEPAIRESFRMLINSDPGLTTVAEAEGGADAVELVARLKPEIVVMDIRMPGMDGLTATRAICEATQSTRIIVLTMFDLDEYVYEAIGAGASGFLLKNSRPEDILRAIHVCAEGNALLSPEVTMRLISDIAARTGGRSVSELPLPELTGRERGVVTLIGQGLSNDEIAERLFLSRTTVRTYVSRLLSKLHARDRAQLVVLAYESGLIQVSPLR
jgi:DNA-binding NarL/FixJ family response regulator